MNDKTALDDLIYRIIHNKWTKKTLLSTRLTSCLSYVAKIRFTSFYYIYYTEHNQQKTSEKSYCHDILM